MNIVYYSAEVCCLSLPLWDYAGWTGWTGLDREDSVQQEWLEGRWRTSGGCAK